MVQRVKLSRARQILHARREARGTVENTSEKFPRRNAFLKSAEFGADFALCSQAEHLESVWVLSFDDEFRDVSRAWYAELT